MEGELEQLHAAGFAWALACCGRNREDALDVLQTSYLKVLDGRARFDGHSSFKTFLFGVIRRTASEQRRRNALRRLLLGEWANRQENLVRASGPEDRLTLLAARPRLARRQREVLELVFYMGLSVEEAAEALSISVGSARVHYARGKKRLARLLDARARA
jgi:RNA polymerase sigma factor (sigma-70 family)